MIRETPSVPSTEDLIAAPLRWVSRSQRNTSSQRCASKASW
jgi:hypothetical protein